MSKRKRLLLTVLWFWVFWSVLDAAQADNIVSFNFSPTSQWEVPFPNDIFTVPDPDMATGLRVDVPLPSDPALISETRDTLSLSSLDGFSIFPRITIPLSGAVPDAESFTSRRVFLVGLAPNALRGKVIPIDQRIIDNSTDGAPRLIFAPDEYLKEQSRYAIVVTRGLTGGGQAFRANDSFRQLLERYGQGEPPGTEQAELYDALDALITHRIAAPADLLTLGVFTTRTVAGLPQKIMHRLTSGQFAVQRPSFDFDGKPGLEFVRAADIITIDSYVHRASRLSDGSHSASFPSDTLRVADSDLVIRDDLINDIFVENVRTGTRVQVPESAINKTNGAIENADISSLHPQPNDELAVLAKIVRMTRGPLLRPFMWDAVGFVGFGRVSVPRYTDEQGRIATIPTGPSFIPSQTGTDSIVFALFLPPTPTGAAASAATPTGGWPVVHLLHGGAETKSSFVSADILQTVPILASHGLASVAFTAVEFEGGPRSYLEITTAAAVKKIPGTGRGIDENGDGLYQATEIYPYPQRVSDLGTVLRSLQKGVDLNGDGARDLARSAARTFIAGISFGGATAFISAGLEPNASVFVSNVPSSEGSRARAAGFHPLVAPRGRSFTENKLAERIPSLLNGPSPLWGGSFNEDIPLKRQPVQLGLAPGAEAIQRALDVNMWRSLENMPLAFGPHVGSGDLRGGPATHLVQVARGDGAAVNPIQALMLRSAGLVEKTAMIQLDNEPLFDVQWNPIVPAELARHVLIALPYIPIFPNLEVGGRIAHYTRLQIADYLQTRGGQVADPDGLGAVFAGDVFQFPLTDAMVEDMIVDPDLPILP